ncbi:MULTISPECIES: carbon-nitrogen hydrolase family protein [unclassified Photobacterium]|uniref:carbon-nitrogen hydrolase family protein n=1 Tax=unclassified Photobacterium TaxID=2628852 RepID=UPI001EE0E945|nr:MULTISPECIES: carbon-nitrogen hydrolase family protein [unclassified Photobacterium]MCG3862824.1 carbon-nitrogen hydrolase family protein [Photobacterium sp. Ph6]MCG3874311.1 carbon-nitrogen hydrolase family protein [Photobacterium sp. Ph5]
MAKIGLVQMNSGADPEHNLTKLKKKVKGLQLQGAKLIVTPENTLVFGSKADYQQWAEPLNDGPFQKELSALTEKLGIWLLLGSMPILQPDGSITSTSLLYNDKGQLQEHYNKLHMFDVDVADKHRSYRESDTFKAGDELKVVETPYGNIGMSICYDVRFPLQYSALREKGADIIVVPAAFTKLTGKAHWEVLLRARAIETQCWVIAAAQWGEHNEGRETWGHSMIIDPWGQIVACQQQGTGVLTANIDLQLSEKIRANMPVAEHVKFCVQPR